MLPNHIRIAQRALVALGSLGACAERDVWAGRRCPEETPICLDASSVPGDPNQTVLEASARPPGDTAIDPARSSGVCIAGRYALDYNISYSPAGGCDVLGLYSRSGLGRWYFSMEPTDDPNVFRVGSTNCRLDQADGNGAALGGSGDSSASDASIDAGGDVPRDSVLSSAALIYGSMNCQNGLLTGTLKGTFRSVGNCAADTAASDFFYIGAMQAVYVPATGRFEGGSITIKETPSALANAATGVGTFTAFRIGAGSPLDPSDANCYGGLRFPDDKFSTSSP
jgi:hypothetical protein